MGEEQLEGHQTEGPEQHVISEKGRAAGNSLANSLQDISQIVKSYRLTKESEKTGTQDASEEDVEEIPVKVQRGDPLVHPTEGEGNALNEGRNVEHPGDDHVLPHRD